MPHFRTPCDCAEISNIKREVILANHARFCEVHHAAADFEMGASRGGFQRIYDQTVLAKFKVRFAGPRHGAIAVKLGTDFSDQQGAIVPAM